MLLLLVTTKFLVVVMMLYPNSLVQARWYDNTPIYCLPSILFFERSTDGNSIFSWATKTWRNGGSGSGSGRIYPSNATSSRHGNNVPLQTPSKDIILLFIYFYFHNLQFLIDKLNCTCSATHFIKSSHISNVFYVSKPSLYGYSAKTIITSVIDFTI